MGIDLLSVPVTLWMLDEVAFPHGPLCGRELDGELSPSPKRPSPSTYSWTCFRFVLVVSAVQGTMRHCVSCSDSLSSGKRRSDSSTDVDEKYEPTKSAETEVSEAPTASGTQETM